MIQKKHLKKLKWTRPIGFWYGFYTKEVEVINIKFL